MRNKCKIMLCLNAWIGHNKYQIKYANIISTVAALYIIQIRIIL